METEIIKSGTFYYDGELMPGKLLKSSGEKEIRIGKYNAVKIGDRHFLLDPTDTGEVFLNLQFRNGRYEYLYKSGDKIIARDEFGEEFMPSEWIANNSKVMTADGLGTVQAFSENIALVKSETGVLKNHYIKNLQPIETKTDFQRLRKGWELYEKYLPQIKSEIRNDNTRLLKAVISSGSYSSRKFTPPPEANTKRIGSRTGAKEPAPEVPNKIETPEIKVPPVETPTVEAPKVGATETVKPKAGLFDKIKNIFTKPKATPAPAPTPAPETVNVNHDLAVPAPDPVKVSSPEHLGKNYVHVDESNQEGQHFHKLTHIDLNPNATNETNKYLYHYEIGDHKDPIVTDTYLHPSGAKESAADPAPSWLKSSIYVPGEKVIDKSTGEQHTIISHLDHNPKTGVLNKNNVLVKDKNGETKAIPRVNVQLDSADKTTHSIVKTDKGNKHLHDLKAGEDRDTIEHNGDKHSVIFSDPEKGLATVNQRTGQMHFTSARDYHKPYLGEVKPVAKEGQTVQIGKQKYQIEHVGGDEKGMSILSASNKLGEKEYFEHPTEKLHSKILKEADLQKYEGDKFSKKPKAPEDDPQAYPHADMEGIEPAEKIFESSSRHPDLTESDHKFLAEQGHTAEDVNKMLPSQVQEILSKKPQESKEDVTNPMPETAPPQSVEDEQKKIKEERNKAKLDQIAEQNDKVFGEHNKTVTKDGVTHRVGIGDLAIKTTLGGGSEVVNKEVPLGKNKTAIVHDIDPVSKQVTFRMKGDDPGDKKKYKTRSIEDFKTHVQENETHDPVSDADVRSRQTAHENEFQNKVYERTAKHLHEKGLEPTKENIEKEINTSNSGLREDIEGYHKTYEKKHNKEKSKGSIVDHPEHETLDIEKTLKNIPNIEEKVKGEISKIKGSREEKRKEIKESLASDIAKEYHSNGKEYDEKPDEEATKSDFDMHRKLGGDDKEIHDAVREKMTALAGQKEHEDKVEKGRQALKEGQEKAKLANEEREKMSHQEYLDNVYNKKDEVKKSSLNEQVGVKQDRGKLAFNNNPNYHNTEFEYHIVPRDKITTSHTPIEGAESKVPFTPNPEHPASGQGREGYHSENIKGETDRKKVKDIADNPEFDQLINTSRSASEQAPPLIDGKGHAINNGRFMAMDMTSPENKKGYAEHLKSQLPTLFPGATPEQHDKMKEGIDKMISEGNTPMLTRVPMNKTDGEAYDLGKHGEDYGKFASATNEGNTKALGESEKIKAVQNSLTDEDKNKLFSFIPEGRTVGNHIKDVKNADAILDHLQEKGIVSDTERSTLYGDDRRLNDKGKKYISDIYKNAYFDKEGADLLDKHKMIGQKVSDFHSRNSDELGEIKTHSKAYDLQHDIKDAFKSMVADKNESAGQQKVAEDSNTVKGLRYLIEYAGKGKDAEGNEYDDGKDALKRYIDSARALKGGGDMFGAPEDEQDPKDFKEKFFDKYAKLYDQQKKIEANKQSPGKVSEPAPEEQESNLSDHPEAKKYKKFADKKSISWNGANAGDDHFKGIHPDNIMHFNQGKGKYGRVSFIAPSEHKIKKHEQYKKLAKEIREEGKDVLVNAFKNPSIVAKINGMKKSFEDEEPLDKSAINYTERLHELRNRRGENISSIAVMNGDKILMGRRRDSNKWTLPGGHAEEGESAEETAIRELEEETGIKAKKLEALGSEEVKNPNAPELMINCFRYDTDEPTSMKDDPDTEVKRWEWIATPISLEILDNLHAKKNVTLKLLGLQNWEKSFVDQMKTAYNNLIKLLS